MTTAVQIAVNGLAGPRCSVEATTDWTILQVHEAICEKINVPVDWQTLLKNTEKLSWEVAVGSLISEGLEVLGLTLLVQEVPEPERTALWIAINSRDVAAALQLLRRRQLPGLNELDQVGRTVLHWAIDCSPPEVAVAIVTRQDFEGINVRCQWGRTALHRAAFHGFLQVCKAIVGRADFTELLAVDGKHRTALQEAQSEGNHAIASLLQEAEAGMQGAES